jgi:hypothetical protein|tara:strand:- start:218 stop:358 length:141 start_codon:yes stop_codon:yes gene_type:complete
MISFRVICNQSYPGSFKEKVSKKNDGKKEGLGEKFVDPLSLLIDFI